MKHAKPCYQTKVCLPNVLIAKTQNRRGNKWFIDGESTNWEDGRPNGISNPPALWTRLRVLGGSGMEVLIGYILTGEPWHLSIYDKGAPIPDLLGQWALGFWDELVFNFWLCLGPLIADGMKSESLVQVELEVKVLSFAQASAAWLAVLVCYLWKAPWHLIKQDWTLLSRFYGYKTRQWMSPGCLSLTEPIKQG